MRNGCFAEKKESDSFEPLSSDVIIVLYLLPDELSRDELDLEEGFEPEFVLREGAGVLFRLLCSLPTFEVSEDFPEGRVSCAFAFSRGADSFLSAL